jgi:hypothetical protein
VPVALRQPTYPETLFHRQQPGFYFTLRYDSHFWWQRKENGPSQGIADGMSRGRDMNVFSMTSAVICGSAVSPLRLHTYRKAPAYCFWVTIGEVDCDGTSDGLAIENLQKVPLFEYRP